MTVSLLYIVVPTILVLAVLIFYMNFCNKRILKELGELKDQLEKMDNVTASLEPVAELQSVVEQEEEPSEKTETVLCFEEVGESEEKDAVTENDMDETASAYNTGKSGKIYTKEELELLIKE